MTRPRMKSVIAWSLDCVATAAEIAGVVLAGTHHEAPAYMAEAIAVFGNRAATAVRLAAGR